MADDIQGAFKEMAANAAKVEKPKQDWKPFAMLTLGLVAGLFVGYQMNLEKSAAIMAKDTCGICQDNIDTMIKNFNSLALQCSTARDAINKKNVSVFPALGLNQTVSVYAS